MSNSKTADWLALTLLLNHQAFRQPLAENWLSSFLAAVCERIPAINGVQVVQMIGNAVVTQASSGQVPNNQPTFDADSPVMRTLNTHEPQIAPDLRAYPILYGENAIGALIVYTPSLSAPTDDALSGVAAQLGPALMQPASNVRTMQLEQIAELSRQAMSTLDQSAILRIVAAATHGLIAADGISVALRWPGEPTLRLYLIDQDQVLPSIALPFEQAGLSAAIESGTPTIIDDLSSSDRPDYQILARHAPPDEWATGPAMHAALIVPLLAGGRTIGTYNLTRRQSSAFTAPDQAVVTQIAAQLAIALENARLFAQAAHRVQIEQLRSQIGTGLSAGHLTTLVLETTQGIGRALNARRARIRFMPPGEESTG